jgi:hypothetical protein
MNNTNQILYFFGTTFSIFSHFQARIFGYGKLILFHCCFSVMNAMQFLITMPLTQSSISHIYLHRTSGNTDSNRSYSVMYFLKVLKGMRYRWTQASCIALLVGMVTTVVGMQMATVCRVIAQPADSKVFVPSVNIVFKSLDSVSKNKVNWKNLAIYSQTTTYSNRHIIALNLGVRASDAFVAAQAKDDDTFIKMALASAALSSKLGVEMDQNANAKMLELVKQGKWDDVKKMLDEQQKTMRQRINRLDKDAATLVVVGGWLEGLQVTSKALTMNYSESASGTIRSPKVLEYLIGELNGLGNSAKGNPLVKKITAQLPDVLALVKIEKPNPIPLDNVKKIATLTGGIVRDIENAKD